MKENIKDIEITTAYLMAGQTWDLVMAHLKTLSPEERRELIEWIMADPPRRGLWARLWRFIKREKGA